MRLVETEAEFEFVAAAAAEAVIADARLPKRVFRSGYRAVWFMDFAYVLSRSFFADVSVLMRRRDRASFLYVARPDPRSYFHTHFGVFPALTMSATDSPEDYVEALHQDPGDSPADAIATTSEVLVFGELTSRDPGWVVYADRYLCMAIAATHSRLEARFGHGTNDALEAIHSFAPALDETAALEISRSLLAADSSELAGPE